MPSEDEIEKLAVKHEAFGFGLADAKGYTTHGFDPEGLHEFVREVLEHWGCTTDFSLPPLPFSQVQYASDGVSACWTSDPMRAYAKAVTRRTVLPRTAAEVRKFMYANCESEEYANDDGPSDDDRYLLTAHDFLTAVDEWSENLTMPAETNRVDWLDPDEGACVLQLGKEGYTQTSYDHPLISELCSNLKQATLALSAVPLKDAQIKSARRELSSIHEDFPDPRSFKEGVRFAEKHHGITASPKKRSKDS